jgi:threonine 3-dehydrogenase
MGKTYLITGGAGNLACQLSFVLATDADRIILLDTAPKPIAPTAAPCIYLRSDLTQFSELRVAMAEYKPDWVLHLASLLSGSTEQDRRRGWRVNADGTFAVLEAMMETGVRKVFFPSSLAAYGGQLPDPLPEDYPQWPTGLYGVTKVACERLGVYYHEKHGVDFRCVRLPAVISRHAPAGAASAYSSRAFIESVQTGKFVFQVRPTTRVAQVYVRDALEGIVALLRAPEEKLTRRVYNICGLVSSAQEIADAVAARVPTAELRFEPDPALVALIESWPARLADDSARRDWGWQPIYDLPRLADDMLADLAGS